jgi:glycosyltransferase involved in cell wall biosynthesis
MRQLRIAYFTHDSLDEGVGSSQVLGLCKQLAILGHIVTIYSFEKQQPESSVAKQVIDQNINWYWFPFESKPFSVVKRIYQLYRVQGNFDVIHARSDLPAFSAVLRRNEPVLWDIRSLWAEQKRILNPGKFNRLVMYFMSQLRRFLSKRVSAYTTLSSAIVPFLITQYPNLPRISAVIPTCVDLDQFRYSAKFPKKRTALLSGTYNAIYNFDLIKEFIQLENRKFGTRIMWARGRESKNADSLAIIETLESKYSEMPQVIENASFGIAVCRNTLGISLDAAMPTKIAEFLAVGRPVIVNSRLGDCQALLVNSKVAVVLDDYDGIDDAIQEITALIDDDRTPHRCRAIAEEYFSIREAANQYTKLYQDILDEAQS